MNDVIVKDMREMAVASYREAAEAAEALAAEALRAAAAVRAAAGGFDHPRGSELHALLLMKDRLRYLNGTLATASTLSELAWAGNELERDLRRSARVKAT